MFPISAAGASRPPQVVSAYSSFCHCSKCLNFLASAQKFENHKGTQPHEHLSLARTKEHYDKAFTLQDSARASVCSFIQCCVLFLSGGSSDSLSFPSSALSDRSPLSFSQRMQYHTKTNWFVLLFPTRPQFDLTNLLNMFKFSQAVQSDFLYFRAPHFIHWVLWS